MKLSGLSWHSIMYTPKLAQTRLGAIDNPIDVDTYDQFKQVSDIVKNIKYYARYPLVVDVYVPCFHWMPSLTSMAVSMMPNWVCTYFCLYNTVPRASPGKFLPQMLPRLLQYCVVVHCSNQTYINYIKIRKFVEKWFKV